MIEVTLLGDPRTKKNSQQVVTTKSGRPFLIQSKAYRTYEAACLEQLKAARDGLQTIADPVNVQSVYYMRTRRKVDLPNLIEATLDILVKAGWLADDNRNIVYTTDGSKVLYDKENPRVEITISPAGDFIPW